MRLANTSVRLVAITLAVTLFGQSAVADNIWGMTERAIKEGERHPALCAKNPNDERCKDKAASTVLAWCEREDAYSRGLCDGTLGGFAQDGAASLPEWQCAPAAVTKDEEQLRRLFLREAHRLPEVLHEPARKLLYYAVLKAFPCPLRSH
jgi:hypothetical protein